MPLSQKAITAGALSQMLEDFLAGAADVEVLEQGAPLFHLSSARYSLSEDHGKCVLHLWSAERNVVRRVFDAERKADLLKLTVLRFGQAHPGTLEFWRTRDRRSESGKRTARARYEQQLRRVVAREFGPWKLEQLSSAMDLERSFGPVYARGLLRRGNSAFALLGVNEQESQGMIEGALTFAILWLDHLRQTCARGVHVEGVKVIAPAGTTAVLRERMAHLDQGSAKWELFELAHRAEELTAIDYGDRGNIATHLVRCPDALAARERFRDSIAKVRELLPEAEVAVLSPAEIAFRYLGLEFARARLGSHGVSLCEELVFGVGAAETVVNDQTEDLFASLVDRVRAARRPHGSRADAAWRLAPERWLESLILRDVTVIDPRLQRAPVYSQVPAFSASDRAVIDVLGRTMDGRLAVVELKADEDIHLPLQGLDYWARVCWHQQRGEFAKFGYFAGQEISAEPPLLFLVAPALRVHPTTDTLLRYLTPEIDCELVAVDEHWRQGVKVVFRKRRSQESGVSG